MKKFLMSLVMVSLFINSTSVVIAKNIDTTAAPKANSFPTGNMGERRGAIKQEVKETREIEKENRNNLLETLKEKIKEFMSVHKTGEITAKTDNTLTIKTEDNKSYTVNITAETQIRRRYGGKSSIDEFSLGDKVNVVGKWADNTKTAINAKLVRNVSIQKRWGAFMGKVTTKNSDSFVLDTKRGNETVYFGSARFINRKEVVITYNDVLVGHQVRVKGVWDRNLNKITEVDEVKDFTLPLQPKNTITPTEKPE